MLAALASLLSGCLFCTAIGCGPEAELDVAPAGDTAAIAQSTCEVCINTRCVTVSPGEPLPGLTTIATGIGEINVDVATTWSDPISMHVVVSADGLSDGDRYAVTVTGADGAVLASPRWIASYESNYPNGAVCGPHCVRAALTPEE